MKRSRSLALLLLPSWFSIIWGLILSVLFIGITSLLLAQNSDKTFLLLDGPYTPLSSLNDLKLALNPLIDTIFNSSTLNKVLFIAFWAIIGFITYGIVFLFKSSVDDSVSFWRELHFVHADPSNMGRRLTTRLLLLTLAMFFWLVYGLLFSWVVLPGSLAIVSWAIVDHKNLFLNLPLAFVIFLSATHVAVILMRFTLLKPRLTGDLDA